jgi:SAM-dependent methyltransferase
MRLKSHSPPRHTAERIGPVDLATHNGEPDDLSTHSPQKSPSMRRSKGLKETYYPESEFGGYSRVDGTVAFYSRVQALAGPEMVALDVGCGRGAAIDRLKNNPGEKFRILKGVCQKVIGIDVDPAGQQNTLIDEFRRIEGDRWPVDSASIDLLVSDAVLEHVLDPDQFFAECQRVVRPGGLVCIRTPNRWGYAALAAAIIPNRWHAKVVSKVQPNRQAKDVFPTHYRANTVRALRRLLKSHQFEGCVYRHIAEPNYLRFSRWSFALGVYLHRWLPALFWPVLFVFARRIEDDTLSR